MSEQSEAENPPKTIKEMGKIKPNVVVLKREKLTTKKAVELLLNGRLKKEVCRYCLYMTYPLTELDQIMQICGKGALYKVTVRDIVASVHPFKVVEDANFPNKICEKCLNQATRSYLFAQQCEQSERAIRNCIDDMYEKFEKLDPLERKKRGRQKLHPNPNVLYTEHQHVIDYADPIYNLINVASVSLTKEPQMTDMECPKCWQVLPNIESLVNHEKIHPKTMWFHCRLCGKSFIKKYQMKRHIRSHGKDKKSDLVEKEMDFVCKQCGHTSDNHNVHLQHIEKHKFKMVLDHLVERKMDKLCSVCLDKKDGQMIDMDKIICLHGGYPELTGDRTLYNILGSTIPEPNYKYQELYVAHKPNIMTMTKISKEISRTKIKEVEYKLMLPNIISLEKNVATKNNCDTLFKFSDPQKLDEAKIIEIEQDDFAFRELEHSSGNTKNKTGFEFKFSEPKTLEEDETSIEMDLKIEDLEQDTRSSIYYRSITNTELLAKEHGDKTNDFRTVENITVSNDILDVNNKVNFSFSSPDYCIDLTNIETTKNTEQEEIKLSHCWIFKKPLCATCQNNSTLNKQDSSTEEKITKKPCRYCWIFKNTEKCEYCSTTSKVEDLIKTIDRDIKEKKIDTAVEKPATLSDIKTAKKRKILNEGTIVKPKIAKWECKICLVSNNMNRQSCICCESDKVYEDPVKINFNFNRSFFDFMKTNTEKEDVDLNQNLVEEPKPTMKSIEKAEDTKEVTEDIVEVVMTEVVDQKVTVPPISTSTPQTDLLIPKPCEETMDVTTEADTMSTEAPLAPLFYRNPFAFNSTPGLGPVPNPAFNFSIGSLPIDDRSKNPKKLKKATKRSAVAYLNKKKLS